MLTKGAIGNLVNRYRAVLTKCNLINTFGSLAVASMLVLGGAGVAEAAYVEGKGAEKVVTADDVKNYGDRALGGWYIIAPPTSEQKAEINSNITINGGKFNDTLGGENNITNGFIIGNHYVSGLSSGEIYEFNTGNTNVTINDAQVEYVIAGTGQFNSNVKFTGKNTNLTINGGFFGKERPDTNVTERYVAGGDFLKSGNGTYITSAISELESTKVTITGGTFHTAIVGGSVIVEVYNATNGNMTSTVGKTNIEVSGGTFYHPIAGGGFTSGGGDSNHNLEEQFIKSEVKEAVIKIDGSSNKLDIQENIYSGGIQRFEHESQNYNIVSTAKIDINNAAVQDIYGTNAEVKIKYTSSTKGPNYWGNEDNEHIYTPLTDKTVNTTLTLTNSTANEVYIPDGTVTLRSEKAGAVDIKTLLTVKNNKAITICADGETNDALDGDVNELKGLITVKEIKYLEPAADEAKTSTDVFAGQEVTMEAGAATGEVTATFDEDGKMTSKTEKQNETNAAMSDLPTINLMLTRVEMNDLRKRMGDIRLLEGDSGVWTRWDGGRLKGDAGLTNDFHKIQIGADTLTGVEGLRLGAAFSYTNSDMDFAKASAESDTLSFAGYGVWTADNGMFADVIARVAFIDTEIQTDKVKGDIDNLALSLSGEFGWRFNFCDRFFVEPQVELTYTYINDDDFTSNGAKFEFDESDSLIGRAGVAAGWALPNDLGELYARASVVQEFMGDGELTASAGTASRSIKTDGDDTWFEYGIGANVKVNKNAYIFADVERTEGAEIEEEWRGTVGVRFSF